MRLKTARELGMRLKEARLEQRITQKELADRIGTSRRWVVQLEKGKSTLQVGLVLRAITALGLECNVRDRASADSEPASSDLADILDGALESRR